MAEPGLIAVAIIFLLLPILILIIWFVPAIKFPAVSTAWKKVFCNNSILAA